MSQMLFILLLCVNIGLLCAGSTSRECRALENPLHGKVAYENTTYQAIANYSCYTGYKFTHSVEAILQTECQSNQTWSMVKPTCIPIDCGIVWAPSHGSIDIMTTTTYLSVVVYKCDDGYISTTTNNCIATRVCQADGTWSGVNPSCLIKECRGLEDPLHGKVTNDNKSYQAIANYSCDTGYKFTYTVDEVQQTKCQSNQTWSIEKPTCIPKDCGNVTAPVHGIIDIMQTTTYLSVVVYKCDEGYISNTTNTRIATRVCQADGKWSGVNMTCLIKECRGLDDPLHGKITNEDNSYQAIAYYSCDTGYKFTHTVDEVQQTKCQSNQTWSIEKPTCIPKDCGNVTAPVHGIIDIMQTTTYLSVVVYKCDEGYISNTTNTCIATRVCQADGKWSGVNMTCLIKECRGLDHPLHGKVTNEDNTYQAIANYSCDIGYKFTHTVDEVQQTKCQSNQTWSIEKPTCIPKDCGYVIAPVHGIIDIMQTTTYLSVVVYKCDVGYISTTTNTSISTRVCQADGKWSGVNPSCLINDCRKLENPLHGKVTYKSTTYQAIANYSCDTGYKFNQTVEVVLQTECQSNQTWSMENPTCIPIDCGSVTVPAHGSIDIMISTTYLSVVVYKCDDGYTSTTSKTSIATRVCQADGTWSGVNPLCLIKDCRGLEDPLHGKVTYDNTTYQAIANYSCDTGYKFTHSVEAVLQTECQSNQTWSMEKPTCIPNECGSVTAPVNGAIDIMMTTTYLSVVIYKCNDGYISTTTNTSFATRVCQDNGKWSGVDPSCLIKDIDECTPFGCGENANCTSMRGGYACRCIKGYPKGNPYIHCYENTIIDFEPPVQPTRGNRDNIMEIHNVQFLFPYFGKQYYQFKAALDGFISIGTQTVYDTSAPSDPKAWQNSSWYNPGYQPVVVLAPLWIDLDTTNITNGGVFVHVFSANEKGNSTDGNTTNAFAIAKEAFSAYINDSSFDPKVVIEVTWKNATCAYASLPSVQWVKRETATMQVILVSDGISTYFMFNYAQEEWTIQPSPYMTGAAGYSNANFTGTIIATNVTFPNLIKTSTNSDLNGRHIFNATKGTPGQIEFLRAEEACRQFYFNQSAKTCLAGKRQYAYACPCDEVFVEYEMTLHKVDFATALNHSVAYTAKTACYQERFYNFYGIKQTCCYEFGSVSTSSTAGGIASIENDVCGATKGYANCCVKSSRLCHLYYEVNPPDDCKRYDPSLIG